MKISNRNSGFTMLEILAVLAIVLILAAILFPAIESAREKSLATACSQNVRQIIIAMTTYEQDKGRFPAGREYRDATGAAAGIAPTVTDMIKWTNAIAPYMHADPNAVTSMGNVSSIVAAPVLAAQGAGDVDRLYPDAYRCPSVSSWDKAGYNMSYGYNHQYLGDAFPRRVATITATNPGFMNYPVAKSAIQRPDRTICVADSDGTGIAGYISAFDGVAPFPGPTNANIGDFGYLIDPTFFPVRNLGAAVLPLSPVASGAAASTLAPAAGGVTLAAGVLGLNAAPCSQGLRSIVSNRHKGSANVGFLDGHVETRVREELYFGTTAPAIAAAGSPALYLSNALWNGFGVDNDLDGSGTVVAANGERILDPNEAFSTALGVGVTPVEPNLIGNYNPVAPGAGYSRVTGLQGNYVTFGPGHNWTAAFLATALGPTLPHVGPFNLNLTTGGALQ